MSIEQSPVKARQGGKGRDILVILVISTVAAAVALWAVFALWAAGNSNVNDSAVSRGEAEITGFTAEETVDVNPEAAAGMPGETNPDDTPVLQQDEPNPATDQPLP